MKLSTLAALFLAATAARCRAEEPSPWKEVIGAPAGPISDTNPSAPEKAAFWDHLVDSSFDQFCRSVHLGAGFGRTDGPLSSGASFDRYLKRVPFGGYAVVDQGEIRFGFDRNLAALPLDAGASASLAFGSQLDGKSIVIRPSPSGDSCKGLAGLARFDEIKAVLPFKAERFAAMEPGEIWKIPLVLDVGVSVNAAKAADVRSATLSFYGGREAGATVTLYRMPEGPIRFRLRLDNAKITGVTPGASNLPVVEFAQNAHSALARALGHIAAARVSDWLGARLSFGRWTREGRGLVMELLLDPKDSTQMDELASVLRGDLDVLRALLAQPPAPVDPSQYGAELKDSHKRLLGPEAAFTGVRDYKTPSSGLHLQIPLIVDFDSSRSASKEKLTVVGDAGLVYDVFTAQRSVEVGGLVVPGLRGLTRGTVSRTVKVAAARDKTGPKDGPVLIYTRLEGFVREHPTDARRMMKDASRITALAGAALPVDQIEPPTKRETVSLLEQESLPPEATYHHGVTSLTLVFSPQAIAQAADANAQAVLAAYRRTLDPFDARLLDMTLAAGRLLPSGRIEFDERALAERATQDGPPDYERQSQVVRWAREMTDDVAGLVGSLARARAAADPRDKAKILRDLMAGSASDSGQVAFDRVAQVVVQLVDPAGLSGEFYADIVKKVKGEPDVRKRYVLREEPSKDPFIAAFSRAINRFAPPAEMTD